MIKSILSTLLVGVLFITQTVSLAYAGENQSPAQDMRLIAANQIESMGQTLQSIMDNEGVLAAHQEFEKTFKTQWSTSVSQVKDQISRLSDAEVNTVIDQLKATLMNADNEKKAQVLFDISWTNRQKLEHIMSQSDQMPMDETIKQIQDRAEMVGYEKTFSELSNLLRNRHFNLHFNFAPFSGGPWYRSTMAAWFLIWAGASILVYVVNPHTEIVVGSVGVFLIGWAFIYATDTGPFSF